MHFKYIKKSIWFLNYNIKEFYFIFTLFLEECYLKKGANFLYAKFGKKNLKENLAYDNIELT